MADTTVNSKVQIEVGISGDSSVKSIKQELREAKNEAINMARQFGENSTQATEAAKRVAELKDEIEDVGLKIKGVNPDKFQRLAELGSGIANGFAAAQGAMALFGSESKDLEKQMAKVQGAIALSQGLQGLKDLRLMLSGVNVYVLALSAAVTLVVKYWKEFSEAITKSFPAFQSVIDFFANFKSYAMGAVGGVIESFKVLGDLMSDIWNLDWDKLSKDWSEGSARIAAAGEKAFTEQAQKSALENSIKNRKFQLDLLEAQGKETLNARLKLQQDELSLLEQGSDEYNAKLIEIEKTKTQIREKAASDKKEKDEKAAKAANDLLDKEIQAAIDAQNAKVKLEANDKKDKEDLAKWQKEQDEKAVKAIFDQVDKEAEALEISYQNKKKNKEAEKKLEEEKLQAVKDTLSAISDLTYLFANQSEEQQKKAFEIQKAVSIAQTLINTYESATKAYNSLAGIPIIGQGLGIAAASAAIAAGLANVKRISETKFDSKTAPSTPPPSFQAPNAANTLPTQIERQITGSQTGASGTIQQTNTTKVIVTETDITRVQNRTKDIQRRATVR